MPNKMQASNDFSVVKEQRKNDQKPPHTQRNAFLPKQILIVII